MTTVHPTAVVDPGAQLGDDAVIGPHCMVGPHVVLGRGCQLRNAVTVTGHTTIGKDNVFYANTVIGEDPQDLKYRGEPTRLEIGDRNTFREGSTVHTGTELGGGVTRVGDDNHIMVGVHIAHDACLADRIILANNVLIAGHVHLEERVIVGGATAMHHFTTVGRYAYIGGLTRVVTDVPPFMRFAGDPGRVRAVNTEGLKRWGFPPDRIDAMCRTFRSLYGKRARNEHASLAEALAAVENNGPLDDHVAYLVGFLKRTIAAGVRGRFREADRTDQDTDLRKFYQHQSDGSKT